ncbi:MAG: endonuclease domain-containing protein [Marinobacter sp.]|uniref:endonuclease domain-containing protein n=1 Tax=Marinobacter sp. TaxID=50741 RepID=UPI001B67E904|nr:endonuclease domain-containing protein [Marinobacter sp.]MBQ0745645.1 endonuclease domain-containing protein [Marinobacter sp.]MBQ0815579.1 endonuclease domain-containing protein [Marinobacter sp.]
MNQTQFAKHLRQNMTDAEKLLWYHLRAYRLNGKRFRRQQPLGPYIVDFVHFGSRVVVEADGGQHNDSLSDKERDAWLRSQGFRVLRFWNHEILRQTDVVLSVIYEALEVPEDIAGMGVERDVGS